MGEKVEAVAWLYMGHKGIFAVQLKPPKSYLNDRHCKPLMTVAQHERIVAGLEARLAEAAEIASLARDYVSSDLVFKRDAFKGYEHCSDVTDVEADLSRIDAFLAQTAEGV